MRAVNLIFPHQLFERTPLPVGDYPVYLLEEYLFFNQYKFHKQKLAFHRASMQAYADHLQARGTTVHYIDAQDKRSDIRKLIPALGREGVEDFHFIDPVDDWLEQRLKEGIAKAGGQSKSYSSPMFLNDLDSLRHFFEGKDHYRQHQFYIGERKSRQILVDANDEPTGGKWSFDDANRKKYPQDQIPPKVAFPEAEDYAKAAIEYVDKHFADCPGSLDHWFYPVTFSQANDWLDQFLEQRFRDFGPYEDALVASESILHHSVFTPMLNTGLLMPEDVLEKAIAYADHHDIPINSLEGFVRQIIGWREFIRGIYVYEGRRERTRNFWGFDRKIPVSWYDGTTGIVPVDQTIRKVLKSGYAHHIERLMVLGNFMLLCEFDPDEVYKWFMEMFIDAYDWVMVPNVYGMSQFADGGLMATKPYISGSNYLKKMSDYGKGDWQQIWDALFWRFMHVHRDFFGQNPRLGMLLRTFDRFDEEKQQRLLDTAERYLNRLDQS